MGYYNMEFLVTKASEDYWYRIEKYDTIDELIQSMEKIDTSYVIEDNFHYKENPKEIKECWHKMTLKDAEKISKLKYNILIYDYWIE